MAEETIEGEIVEAGDSSPSTDIALSPGAAMAKLREKLMPEAAGFNPVPVLVKIIHPAQLFDFGGVEQSKRIVGLILASKMVRVFYPRFNEEAVTDKIVNFTNKRPLCSSKNYKMGEMVDLTDSDWENAPEEVKMLKEKIAEGAGRCANCPLKEWGAAELTQGEGARGTACKELRRLLFWRSGLTIPTMLSVPTSSVRNLDAYLSGLLAAEPPLACWQAVTEISLEPRERGDRHWSICTFSKMDLITDEMAVELVRPVLMRGEKVSLFEGLVAIFNEREIGLDEYADNGTEAGGDDF